MPAFIKHDCPHCTTRSLGFNVAFAAKSAVHNNEWTTLLLCPSCGGGVVASIHDKGSGQNPVNHPWSLDTPSPLGHGFTVVRCFPSEVRDSTPEHLPEPVARAFREASQILPLSPNAAAVTFRRALELGLKALAPEVEAWKLEKRIDKLADMHLLTPAIRDWAHQLRLDGNEAVHGVEDVTRGEAEQIQSLTRYVLTYLYTLPKQVEVARAPKGETPPA